MVVPSPLGVGQSQNQAMATFLDIRLPTGLAGEAQRLCEEEIWGFTRIADEALLVVPASNSNAVAKCTIGLGPILRTQAKVKLLILSSGSDDEEAGSQHPSPAGSDLLSRRLGLLKPLLVENRLELSVRSMGDENAPKNSFLLLKDPGGNLLQIVWEPILDDNVEGELQARLAWSFGDPQKRVRSVAEKLAKLIDTPATAPGAASEQQWREFITSSAVPDDVTEEPFETADSGLPVRLFPHQRKAIDDWFANGERGVFKMCTGAGKTISSLATVRRVVEQVSVTSETLPVVIVTVPTRVLADQWCGEIQKMGFLTPVQAYNSVDGFMPFMKETFRANRTDTPGFVVTTYRTFADPRFQRVLEQAEQRGQKVLWIADEAHNLATRRLQDCMTGRGGLFSQRLALTATPEIEGQPDRTAQLNQFFGGEVADYSLGNGIKDGVLCKYEYHPHPVYLNQEIGAEYLDLLKRIDETSAGSPVEIDLYRQKRDLVRKSGIQIDAFKGILAAIGSAGGDLSHSLIYCPPGFASKAEEAGADESDESADESEESRLVYQVTQHLIAMGCDAGTILGTTPSKDREQTLKNFRDGKIKVLCAIGCLDEGVDVPSIRRAIVLSSVNREKQFIQRRGRILRQSKNDPGKVAEIYDVIVLPHGSHLPPSQAKALLSIELRRYSIFANLAQNRTQAAAAIETALDHATKSKDELTYA